MYRRWQPGIGDRNEIAYRIFAAAMISTASFAQVLDREPPAGSLPAGATVHVKSVKCKSEVMIVTGGSNMDMSTAQKTTGGSGRTGACKT
jgi:hypothetical protein